jgi:hypothetical protein
MELILTLSLETVRYEHIIRNEDDGKSASDAPLHESNGYPKIEGDEVGTVGACAEAGERRRDRQHSR